MGENIYLNPSGFTELPWEFSVKWFKDRILDEVAISQEHLPKIHQSAHLKLTTETWLALG